MRVSHIYGIHFFEWRARRGSAAPRSVNHRKEFAGGSPVVTHQFQALRRFRDAVLFRSVRPSSIQWFLFWLLDLTVQSSRPAFGGRLTFGVSHMKKWKLDEADVYELGGGAYTKSHGNPTKTKRSVEVKLVHKPTGISVSQQSALESMSRPAAAKMRAQLRMELLPKLEELVAKHLRISGR